MGEGSVVAEVTEWVRDAWDPELTVGDWWQRLAKSGWAVPTWPTEWFGRDLSRELGAKVRAAITAAGALGPPGGIGVVLAGPTILAHGTAEQKHRFLGDIVSGQRSWCQLFSEPGAGSDLAGLQTRAVADGDTWIVNGQKVWTSGAQAADFGMLLARTDLDVPKHHGITFFVIDMHQPAVEVRPLVEMTGRSLFNEVFLSDAHVSTSAAIGGLHRGWPTASTTLAFERAGMGPTGGEVMTAASPGTVRGHLDRPAGEFVRRRRRTGSGSSVTTMFDGASRMLIEFARANGRLEDPTIRQALMRLHAESEVGRYLGLRQKALTEAGESLPGAGNIGKLSMSRIIRQARDLGLQILGPAGTLHAYRSDDREKVAAATGSESCSRLTELTLFSPAASIYGGTDEIQRNVLAKRVLGLPEDV